MDDPQLEPIVAEAIAYNLDLRQAAAKVRIAQQAVVVVGAQLLPQVGASVSGRKVRYSLDKLEDEDGTTHKSMASATLLWQSSSAPPIDRS